MTRKVEAYYCPNTDEVEWSEDTYLLERAVEEATPVSSEGKTKVHAHSDFDLDKRIKADAFQDWPFLLERIVCEDGRPTAQMQLSWRKDRMPVKFFGEIPEMSEEGHGEDSDG